MLQAKPAVATKNPREGGICCQRNFVRDFIGKRFYVDGMIIWILALVLIASLASLGYTLGVIRIGFSLIGLLVGAVLAGPLAHTVRPLIGLVGVKNPVLQWLVSPVLVVVLSLIVFKVIGLVVHRKVDVYYKYKAGDIRMGLWNRLSPRLGMCLGMANAALYLILISLFVYVASYATTQMVNGDDAATTVKFLNSAGKDLQGSGMAKITAAIDHTPDSYYKTVDLIGLVYHNDLLEGRLSRYPAFLSLGEKPEFQAIGNDKAFTELRQRQPPMSDILKQSTAQAVINNPDTLKQIWDIVQPNLADLRQYLTTGKSPKYDDEKILGRWDANVNLSLAALKSIKPNISPLEMKQVKRLATAVLEKTTLVAAPDNQAFLKNLGKVKLTAKPNPPGRPVARPGQPAAPANVPIEVDMQSFTGKWSPNGLRYEFSFPEHSLQGSVEGDRLTVTGSPLPIVFEREY